MIRKILSQITGKRKMINTVNRKDAESIFDSTNDSIYDTLSIDCSDDIEDVIDSVESIDACEDMVDYYDEY